MVEALKGDMHDFYQGVKDYFYEATVRELEETGKSHLKR
jgi:hypothetical protein